MKTIRLSTTCAILSALVLSAAAQAVRGADKPGDDASRITVDFKATPLTEAAAKLAELSGNNPLEVSELKDQKVTLAAQNLTYWEAVDQLAAAAKAIYTPTRVFKNQTMEPRLKLVEADKDAKITGYAGPVVVKVDAIAKPLTFRPTAWKSGASGGGSDLNLKLAYFWEDRLEPMGTEIELTKAQTPQGASLLPKNPAARRQNPLALMAMPTALAKEPPGLRVSYNLTPPDPEVRTLAELAGVVRLEFGSGQRELEIADLLKAEGKEFKDGDWTIKVVRVTPRNWKNPDTDAWNSLLQIGVEVQYKGQTVPMPPVWNAGDYGWYLQLADGGEKIRGNRYQPSPAVGGGGIGQQPGGNGVQGRPGTALSPAIGPGAVLKEGENGLLFNAAAEFTGNVTLKLRLPKNHQIREYPFSIKDIPLP